MKPDQAVLTEVLEGFPSDKKWYHSYMYYNWSRLFEDFSFIRKHVPTSARVLDVGAVPPLLSALLKGAGYSKITVADPNASAFKSFFDRNQIQHVDLDVLNSFDPSLNEAFDLVCLNEVIEHLSGNLMEVVERVTKCVAPGGYLLVTTPNLRSVCGIAAILLFNSGLASKPYETVRAQYERSSAKYGYYGHLREFTPKEVVDLVSSFGMTHVASKYQRNYLHLGKVHRVIAMLEFFTPGFRTFGKYLFRKP